VGVENTKRAIRDVIPRALAVSPDGRRLAGSDGYATWMIEPDDPSNYGIIRGAAPKDAKPVPAGVAWSADSKRLAAIDPKVAERTVPSGLRPDTHWPVRLWSATPGGSDGVLFGHDERVTAVAWSKDGKFIASGDETGTVILWDAAAGKELWRRKVSRDDAAGGVHSLAICPADNTVAVAVSLGNELKASEGVPLLDPKTGSPVGDLHRASRSRVASVAWEKDGKFVVTGGGGVSSADDGTLVAEVVVWERKP
jgi:WD40 repeat protein